MGASFAEFYGAVDGGTHVANISTGFPAGTSRVILIGEESYVQAESVASPSTGLVKLLATGDEASVMMTKAGQPTGLTAHACKLYCRDNGAGKSQLVVIFDDFAPIVLATQA